MTRFVGVAVVVVVALAAAGVASLEIDSREEVDWGEPDGDFSLLQKSVSAAFVFHHPHHFGASFSRVLSPPFENCSN